MRPSTPATFQKASLAQTDRRNDFTTILSVSGLKPDTLYEYRLGTPGNATAFTGRFRTFSEQGKPAKFSIGFGGGAGYTPQYERMWNTITSRHFTAFLFLGDNVYIDHPTRQAVQ